MGLRVLLRKRRNVYNFLVKPVPGELLKSILEDSVHVPSAGFTQDFDLVVVRDKETRAKLAAASFEDEYVKKGEVKRGFVSSAPVIVVPCGNKSRFESKYGSPADKTARAPWWLIDAGFASLALILSAYEKGLAGSFLGAIDDEKVTRILGLPRDGSIVPLGMILLGCARTQSRAKAQARVKAVKKRRIRSDDLIHWEGW